MGTRTPAWRVLILVLIAAATLTFGSPALGAAEGSGAGGFIFFTDSVGDATHLNDQGLGVLPAAGPDLRPASLGSADLVSGKFETMYQNLVERDAHGQVSRIRRTPTGVRIVLSTAEPASPTFGPTVMTQLWLRIGNCDAALRMFARGPMSEATDPSEHAELQLLAGGCGLGDTSGISLRFEGKDAIIELPAASVLTGFDRRPLLTAGTTISSHSYISFGQTIRYLPSATGAPSQGPDIDVVEQKGTFMIGSELPPDVDCGTTPSHELCQG